MRTLQDQYKLIKEGKGHKDVFLKEAKQMFPNYIRNAATFEEASNILKDKNVISENLVGIEPINTISRKKETYEEAFEKFLEEARKKNDNDPNAEIKKVSQQVEDKLKHNFDRTDKKNPDNQIFGEIMKGYYCEMKDPKNVDKTEEQLRDIVLKNLAKDPIYYTKNGMFGEKGVGVEMDVPGLGEPKEPKGPYKSSGYGTLKEGQMNEGVTSDYEERINLVVDSYFGGNPEVKKAAIEWASIKGARRMGGRAATESLFRDYWEDFGREIGNQGLEVVDMADDDAMFQESLQESKLRKVINSMIKQELISENKKYQKTIKEIEKASKLAELTTKMEALDKAIEEKNSRLNSIEESEEMKELVDKKAMKELQKEIKLLEKYKGKVLKMYEKLTKTKKKEVIDEDTVTEAEGDVDDAKTTADELERAADAAKEIADTELFEMEPSKEYLDAKEEAEERYENGEEIEVIVKDFPEFQEMLFQDLKGKYEG